MFWYFTLLVFVVALTAVNANFDGIDTWCISRDGKYLGIDDHSQITLEPRCNKWEHFRIVVINERANNGLPIVGIQNLANHFCYLRSYDDQVVSQTHCLEQEHFYLHIHQRLDTHYYEISLQRMDGRFLTITPSGEIYARTQVANDWEKFLISTPGYKYLLDKPDFLDINTWCISRHGKFLGINSNHKVTMAPHCKGDEQFRIMMLDPHHPNGPLVAIRNKANSFCFVRSFDQAVLAQFHCKVQEQFHLEVLQCFGHKQCQVAIRRLDGIYISITSNGEVYAKNSQLEDSNKLIISPPQASLYEYSDIVMDGPDFRGKETWCLGYGGRFIGINQANAIHLVPHCQQWEQFRIMIIKKEASKKYRVTLKNKANNFCFVRSDGSNILTQTFCQEHEKFTLYIHEKVAPKTYRISLKDAFGKYLTITPTGQVFSTDKDFRYLQLSPSN